MQGKTSALILALSLGACSRPAAAPSEGSKAAPIPPPRPAAAPAPPPGPGEALPPPGAAFRYVGRWAARAPLCDDGAWLFAKDRLTTAGEVSCTFNGVGRTASGYDIDASCAAEGPARPYRLRLTFAESAKAMMVAGGPFDHELGLIWCGPGA